MSGLLFQHCNKLPPRIQQPLNDPRQMAVQMHAHLAGPLLEASLSAHLRKGLFPEVRPGDGASIAPISEHVHHLQNGPGPGALFEMVFDDEGLCDPRRFLEEIPALITGMVKDIA